MKQNSRFTIWTLLIVLMPASSCNWTNAERISTENIHIPATASKQGLQSMELPEILFNDTLANLGIITEGTQAEFQFEFVNSGKRALVVSDVNTSCGCTLAENWPRDPIAPGENGVIAVRFDSRGRVGQNRKEIYVVTNAVPSTKKLALTAEVIGPQSTHTE